MLGSVPEDKKQDKRIGLVNHDGSARITVWSGVRYVWVAMRAKTQAGGWRDLIRKRIQTNDELSELIDRISATDVSPVSPRKFSAVRYRKVDRFRTGWVAANHMLSMVRVIGMAVLGRDGSVTMSAAEPGTDPWFLFDCVAPSGAVLCLLWSHHGWLPVKRQGSEMLDGKKLFVSAVGEHKSKSSINYQHMGPDDEALLKEAASRWLNSDT